MAVEATVVALLNPEQSIALEQKSDKDWELFRGKQVAISLPAFEYPCYSPATTFRARQSTPPMNLCLSVICAANESVLPSDIRAS
jgi:hypothetical protein